MRRLALFPTIAMSTMCLAQVNFQTADLQNERLIRYLHDGRFNRVTDVYDLRVKLLFLNHLYSFGEICPFDLPADKVKIMVTVCDGWSSNEIHYPFAPWKNSSQTGCTKWDQKFTGVYADPRFYALRDSTALARDIQKLEEGFKNPTNFMRSMLGQDPAHTSTRDDSTRVIRTNGCKSPALKTFSENLLRFVGGSRSLQAEAGEPSFWQAECARRLPSILPGVTPGVCGCLDSLLGSSVRAVEMFA
ncbi:MAG: hypothetical protein ACKV2U_20985, partial [Bryobacteraceae bacterium]